MGPLRPLWLRIANDRSCALAPSVIAWGAHGMSGAEGRPAVPLTWRRQPPLTPQPTFTKTQSRGSSWVERLSASVFFSMTATRRFRPSIRPTSGAAANSGNSQILPRHPDRAGKEY
jgi:hypothetical protein